MEKQFNPFSLEGKVILITGGSSGIGQQCAVDCSRMGAKVIIVARNEERMRLTLSSMQGEGHNSYSYDFSDLRGIRELVKRIIADNGKVDGVVCCAGTEITAPAKLIRPEDYENLFRVNSISSLELVRHLTGVSNCNNGCSIILVSSISALIARGGLTAYAASKGALISAAKVLALELCKRQIRVNCISPGTIMTPMMQDAFSLMTEEERHRREDGFLLGLGEVSDISNACLYLLSDASKWVTGTNLIVDGGFTCR